jgi:lipid-A-disaccharide synthase
MRYYIIAGEASGDLHGSNLMKELRHQDSNAEFRFWGGDLMKGQGGTLVKHYKDLAFMGFIEVVLNLRTILRNLDSCISDIKQYQPDVVILIDYPGFNLRIASKVKQLGVKVFYYISPQLWAWNASRVNKVKRDVDRMFVILPFEEEFYQRFNYKVEFTGHPLLDVIHPGMKLQERSTFIQTNNLDERPIIALLPGSRKQEISTILGVMLQVVTAFPNYQFVVAGAPSVPLSFYQDLIGRSNVKLVFGQTYDLLHFSEAALVTSGTATLETALMMVPQVVCYKGNPVSFAIARQLVKVKYISLVNLICDRMIVKELIQSELTVANLVVELKRIISEPHVRERVVMDYTELKSRLGGSGASAKAAGMMIQYLTKNEV